MWEEKNSCFDVWKAQWVKMFGSVKVWPKWQISIPKDIRDALNINTWDVLLAFSKHDKAFWFLKVDDLELFIEYIQKEMNVLKEMAKSQINETE